MIGRLLVALGWPACPCCGRPADLFAGVRLRCLAKQILGGAS
jgi:hypothetical protein